MSDPVITDLQDPLPESNWFWRRVFTFAVTAAVLWMLWGAIDRLGAVAMVRPENGVPALLKLCKALITFSMMMITYYMVAPSAEQIIKMMKTATLLKSGVQVAGTAVTRDQAVAKTVGLPPTPPIPGASDEKGPSVGVNTTPQPDGPPWAS
jgi:hypothetical protein